MTALQEVPTWLTQWATPGGLIVLTVWFILTGRLVPRTTLLDVIKQRDKAVEAQEKLLLQNQQLIENNRITSEFFKALQSKATKDGV